MPFLEGQDRFDYGRQTTCRFTVADICFDLGFVIRVSGYIYIPQTLSHQTYRANHQRWTITRRETPTDALNFDGIPNGGAGSMTFNVISVCHVQSRVGVSLANDSFLKTGTGLRNAVGPAVGIDYLALWSALL